MTKFFCLFSSIFSVLIVLVPSAHGDFYSKQVIQNSYESKWSRKQKPILIADSSSAQPDSYVQAEALFKEKDYDGVIKLLAGPAYENPNDFKSNILLAKAQVGKCAILKEKGDMSYKTLIYQPYQTGRRLHIIDETRPEPYYIVARSLLINNRAYKAKRTIKKALYFSPNNPDYLLVLADAYYAIAELNTRTANSDEAEQSFSKAKTAYEKALEMKEEFRIYVEEKITKISEELK